jgi:hypothetical protein
MGHPGLVVGQSEDLVFEFRVSAGHYPCGLSSDSLLVALGGRPHTGTRFRRVDQGPYKQITVLVFQCPGRMLLDGLNRRLVGMLNHEVREREPFDAGRPLNALLLLWKKVGFGPFRASIAGSHGVLPSCTEVSVHDGSVHRCSRLVATVDQSQENKVECYTNSVPVVTSVQIKLLDGTFVIRCLPAIRISKH